MRQNDSLHAHHAWVIRVPDIQLLDEQARDSDDLAHTFELLQMAHTPPPPPSQPPSARNNKPSSQPATTRTSKSLAQTIAEEWSRESKEAKEKWRMADAKLRDYFPPSRSSVQRKPKAKM
ncbi:uncharacterized protein STEHIDRAFT_160470 [Stereum hirsutum FP-91666 SS1]|uniref:uncharacterized protein n=1 Tax=Stereum hirsutum (strain FP-91666) TaxID=721885 RepID=UPI0004449C06|nr:uncharacterized protein STEHIDRAFT_160470 [Stereum hirsutum FP-91666 SS1]EIM82847.1 hypothetical protein STEHIDRAFT_160470 [Stereum hirsutum FP-91666 SS1]